MKTRFKKLLLVSTGLTLLASTLIGCSKGGEGASNTVAPSDNKPKVTWETAPKITVAMNMVASAQSAFGKTGDDQQDNPYTRYIFEKTGIRLVPIYYPGTGDEFKQKLAVELAGGKQIDMFQYFDVQQEWMDNGTIVPINDKLKQYKDKMPNMTANVPQAVWEGSSRNNGQNYGFPTRPALGNPNLSYFWVRKDWVDKLGLQMPKTTDDLTSLMKAFVKNDPDGNGKNDTFGMVPRKNFGQMNEWMTFLGANPWSDVVIDGKRMNPYATENGRYAFKTVQSWFKDGLIDQEGITDDKAQETKIVNNKVGIVETNGTIVLDYARKLLQNGFKDAKWAMVENPIVNSKDGKFYANAPGSKHQSITFVTSIAKDWDSITKLMDWFYSPEGTFFTEMGLPGKEHTVEGGKPVYNNAYVTDGKSYLGMYGFGRSYNHVNSEAFLAKYKDEPSLLELANKYASILAKDYDKYVVPTDRSSLLFPGLAVFKQYPDYRKGIDTYQAKFFLGNLDPLDDAAWKAFLDENNKYGMDKVYEAVQKEVEKSTAKK
ncbi:type 2 periplasmic-binding domain-containing protein [Paenibacillus roseipurpureus]|uniref:ABC transporter substrate-binding protein n=1 Tax=Paenibacillus roseopurpureus TaxID=2918901 RepID=A0AA96RJ90_9BACL|nr:hypothetical protein [Paenibacillus sp. MBLB1832]WNR42906.1 hypothetical protein MJB10_17500 [Paenibacillus sp. MBLB1832]